MQTFTRDGNAISKYYCVAVARTNCECSMSCVGNQGALAGERKRRVFQTPCEVQSGLDLLCPDCTKDRNKREPGHSFGVCLHSATKENAIRAYSGGFQKTPAHSKFAAQIHNRFVSPAGNATSSEK